MKRIIEVFIENDPSQGTPNHWEALRSGDLEDGPVVVIGMNGPTYKEVCEILNGQFDELLNQSLRVKIVQKYIVTKGQRDAILDKVISLFEFAGWEIENIYRDGGFRCCIMCKYE
jgi:hypothetical protein